MTDEVTKRPPGSDKRTMDLLLMATGEGDLPASDAAMDLIFAAAALMLSVHMGSGGHGDICPPMTGNKLYNAAAQGVADLATSMLGRETEEPS